MRRPYPQLPRRRRAGARGRQPGQQLEQIAAAFSISESCLTNWLRAAGVDDDVVPGPCATDSADLRVARKWTRLPEQENEVLALGDSSVTFSGKRGSASGHLRHP